MNRPRTETSTIGTDTTTIRTGPARVAVARVAAMAVAALVVVALAVVFPGGTASAGTVTVAPGQTLSQVAAEVGTTVAALAAANGITNPNVVDAGTVLEVPGQPSAPAPVPTATATTTTAATTVTVAPGETLSALAARYGTTAAALAALNGIADPDLIVAGSVLRVPAPATAAPAAPAPAPAPAFTTVEVLPGQTLSALAARYATTAAALATANGISNPNRIDAGTVLRIPTAAPGPVTAASGVTTVGTITVHVGDTLTSLAAHYGTTAAALAAVNKISNPNLVWAGMQLTLPAAAVVVSPAASAPVATGAYPTALLAFPSRMALQPDFVHAASASGVPVSLLEAVCWWESGWQTTAVSSTGALGVCQILPSTAAFVSSSILQVAPLDPRVAADNIDLAAAYLRYLLNAVSGNAAQALAAYSQGAASVAHHGILPATQTYVTGILAYASIFAGNG